MKTGKDKPTGHFQLLNPTERLIKEKKAEFKLRFDKGNIDDLIHELQIYQIELELQNNELKRAKRETELLKNKYEDFFECCPIGYLTFDHEGFVQDLNLSMCKMLGITKDLLLDKMFHIYIEPKMWDGFNHFFIQTLCQDTKQSTQLKLRNRNGECFYALLEGIRVEDEQNGLPKCRIAVIDVTLQRSTEEAIRNNSEELKFYKKSIEEKNCGFASTLIDLAKSERDLRKTNMAKDMLLSLFTQELKGTISLILSNSLILNNEGLVMEHQKLKEQFSFLVSEALKASNLLDDLLKGPTACFGNLKFCPSEIKLYDMVEETVSLIMENSTYPKTIFRQEMSKRTKVFADREMLKAVMVNLLTKTIKSSPKATEVTILAYETGNFVEVKICDSDTPKSEPRIKLSNNLQVNTQRKLGSVAHSGFELMLCKELIEAQGGAALFPKGNNVNTYSFTLPRPEEKLRMGLKKNTTSKNNLSAA